MQLADATVIDQGQHPAENRHEPHQAPPRRAAEIPGADPAKPHGGLTIAACIRCCRAQHAEARYNGGFTLGWRWRTGSFGSSKRVADFDPAGRPASVPASQGRLAWQGFPEARCSVSATDC